MGDSGTGKSHLLIALGTEAAMKGLPGQVRPGDEAGRRARRSRRREIAGQDHRRYGRVDLLCIDETDSYRLQ
ncbi:hypothetical protein [Streptomyces sp. NPDC059994]|uniref:hypothetical protein n=1 Tax=Streptomyces sp. NPDC059994 TaxID=3347029 RepID=UPI0036BD6BDC